MKKYTAAMKMPGNSFRQSDLRRRFDRAAATFQETDQVHRTTCQGLLDRLQPVVLNPSVILDLGTACGDRRRDLGRAYKGCHIIGLDISPSMLRVAKKNRPLFSRHREVCGDAVRLPFRNQSVDLVFANLLLPWISDLPACLGEVARVLKSGGLFVFSTLGPDSLGELRNAWQADPEYEHVNPFPDMHDIGDALVQSGLLDPVVDMDRLRVTYNNTNDLYRDLTGCGARNSLAGRRGTLTGVRRFRAMEANLAAADGGGNLALNLELVFGHAWGAGQRQEKGAVYVEADAIPVRRRR